MRKKTLARLATVAAGLVVLAYPCFGDEDLRFGMMTHFAQDWATDLLPRMVEGGVNTVRDELYWESIENAPQVYTFPASYDAYMRALSDHHISPLIILSFANSHYDGGQTPYTDAGVSAYANYGKAVLNHYGSQIKEVEVWNEFNGSFCTGPALADRATSYAKLLGKTYSAIKDVRPDVTVVGGSTVGVPLNFFKKLFDAGALASMDVISVHPYCYDVQPEGIEHEIQQLDTLVKSYNDGKSKPIWVTEIGWYLKESMAPGDLQIDEAAQAKFLVRAYTLLLSAGVERVYWYLFRDYAQFSTMGVVHNDSSYAPKLAFYAFSTLNGELANAAFDRRENTLTSLYSLVFRKPNGDEVRVLWSTQPTLLNLQGATGAVDLYGTEFETNGPLTITDTPVFIEGPMTGLPHAPPPVTIIADSEDNFSAVQGEHGWEYGYFLGEDSTFNNFTTYRTTDWDTEWYRIEYPYLTVSSEHQHPSAINLIPVAAVRRWISDRDGQLEIHALFRCGLEGDGVRAKILVNGDPIFLEDLGAGNSVSATYDAVVPLTRGSTVDFVVDCGVAANFNFDSTAVVVQIIASGSP